MADFVAHTATPGKNPVVARHSYAKLGKANAFEAQPAVMHFGGYSLNRVHQQKLRIVNTSGKSQRVNIIVPTTPYFRAKYKKKGLIAPGMAEEVTVEFMPTEWRYYYDCVRLHSKKENLLVPLHAYPVMNEVVFPSRIDFGVCPLSETATRQVVLECKVPIQFEFELEVGEYHPDFVVTPMSGIVPANGTTTINIDFTPVKLTVARMVLIVKISQFEFEPIRCEIIGSAAAGMSREAAMKALFQEVANKTTDPALKDTVNMYTDTVDVPLHGVGSGAVFDPGYTAVENRTKRRRQRATARTRKLATITGSQASPETNSPPQPKYGTVDTMIDGVRIPAQLNGMPAANFILTQAPGKMKPKDLAEAIEQQNKQRAKQKKAQEKLRATMGASATAATGEAGPGLTLQAMVAEESGAGLGDDEPDAAEATLVGGGSASPSRRGHRRNQSAFKDGASSIFGASAAGGNASVTPARLDTAATTPTFADMEQVVDMDVDDEAPDDDANKPVKGSAEDPRRLKEMVFLQDVSEIDKCERQREFKSASEWVGEVEMADAEIEEVMMVRIRVRNEAEARQREHDRRTYTTRAKGPHQVVPVKAVAAADGLPQVQPRFDPYSNDVWRKRTQVLKRLRGLVTDSIVRRRADSRLAALQRRVAEAAARGRQGMAEYIAKDNRLAATAGAGMKAAAGGAAAGEAGEAGEGLVASEWLTPALRIDASRIQREGFPMEAGGADGGTGVKPVPVSTPYDFQDLAPLRMVPVPESEVMNYSPVPVPAHPGYTHPELQRPVRRGASEESSVRLAPSVLDARIVAAQATAELAMPGHVAEPWPVQAGVEYLLPNPELRPMVPLEEVVETSVDYKLRASMAKPFSLQSWSRPPPPPPAAEGGDSDNEAEVEKPADPVPARDINGLVITESQAASTEPHQASLRALAPTLTLSQLWRPRRERADPDYKNPHPWTPPELPEALDGPQKEDYLSDDSESDVEEDAGTNAPTWEQARGLFAVADEEGAAGEEGDESKGEDGAEAAAEAAGPATEIPRDRARLALAARERARAQEAAGWLEQRLRKIDKQITDPALRFSFDAVPRIRWS